MCPVETCLSPQDYTAAKALSSFVDGPLSNVPMIGFQGCPQALPEGSPETQIPQRRSAEDVPPIQNIPPPVSTSPVRRTRALIDR